MKGFMVRVRRYFVFLVQYFIFEKPSGLDFSMRDKKIKKRTNGKSNGYAKTSEKHVREIFDIISKRGGEIRFLDVGCGKGVVLKEAAKYPFEWIDGIEMQSYIVEIARRNFKILKIDDRVRCFHCDAVEFNEYGKYNVFFLYNPFPAEIVDKVVKKIMNTRPDTEQIITLIYSNPICMEEIEKMLEFWTKKCYMSH